MRSLLFVLLAASSVLAQQPAPARAEIRAVWVTRFDYRTADDVRRIVDHCADLGANRILFQVRGAAATFYPSTLEPWDPALGGGDPGFDPLAVAVEAAKARGVALEAWLNAMPLWRGTAAPVVSATHGEPAHPYVQHPEWAVVGSDGKPQRRTAHYVAANPALAEVRAHIAAVASEVACRYAVDAVHLDYIRYVTDLENTLDFSRDPTSLRLFGKDPDADREGWARFKAEQITAVVREVRAAIRGARPGCKLTAAVYPTRASRAKVAQDVEGWVHEGLVDAIYPMTYADDDAEFQRRIDESLPLGRERGVPVVPGVGCFKHPDPAQTLRQMERVHAGGGAGVALFCYASLFDSADAVELPEKDAEKKALRLAALQAAWRP